MPLSRNLYVCNGHIVLVEDSFQETRLLVCSCEALYTQFYDPQVQMQTFAIFWECTCEVLLLHLL